MTLLDDVGKLCIEHNWSHEIYTITSLHEIRYLNIKAKSVTEFMEIRDYLRHMNCPRTYHSYNSYGCLIVKENQTYDAIILTYD